MTGGSDRYAASEDSDRRGVSLGAGRDNRPQPSYLNHDHRRPSSRSRTTILGSAVTVGGQRRLEARTGKQLTR
jgi:hypothetical protein